jgi:hypothetical protein
MRNKKFFIARLKHVSLPEVIYRLKHTLLTRRLGHLLERNRSPVTVPEADFYQIDRLRLPDLNSAISQDHIGQILDGKVFNLNTDSLALKACEKKCQGVFFSDIEQEFFPDIRAVWEPARLQHITILLAQVACNSKSPDFDEVQRFSKRAVLQWINENPFLFGPHYMSAMECGLRIPIFFYCLKLLSSLSLQEYRMILNTIYLHAWWISRRLSLYSSLGNHTIAECVGLIFAGALFNNTQEGNKWIKRGTNLLEKELEHQILEDGGSAEQSLNYHRFVLDLYWLSVDFLEKNSLHDCSDIRPRLLRGEDFLKAFQDTGGNMPSIGDSDDGCAIAPGITPRRAKTNPSKPGCKVFKQSGYTVITTENQVAFTFDHGPLGMPPLYNHGHADALAITLTREARQMLVDPGTYRYNGVSEWRKYFKGTRAHNTVTIDGLDQAVQETGFIWSKPFRTEPVTCQKEKGALFIEAMHNGYARLEDSVWHKRAVLFLDGTNFIIKDSFKGKGIHDFEVNYHLHPDAVASKTNGFWLIDNQEVKIFLRLLYEDDFVGIRGQKEPLLGWYSPSYGIKKKCGVLNCTKRGMPREISFVTAICTESPLKVESLHERLMQFEEQAKNP